MTASRRDLYRRGEPLGACCTRRKLGGGYICGGGGDGGSSSSSTATTTQTTTTNVDKRLALNSGIGISSDQSTVNVQALDGEVVKKALDTVSAADATAGAGFEKLLGLADKLFTGAGQVISKTQDASLAQLATLNTAANDQRGTIDQKTIIVLAVAGAAALAFRRKG